MLDTLLDPLGTGTYIICGIPEAVEICRAARIEKSDLTAEFS
ncbi:MAG: hypothetical protein R3B48_27855 [Kofleriaceae bacterium]